MWFAAGEIRLGRVNGPQRRRDMRGARELVVRRGGTRGYGIRHVDGGGVKLDDVGGIGGFERGQVDDSLRWTR